MSKSRTAMLCTLFSFASMVSMLSAQQRPGVDEELFELVSYRNLGPFRAGGWVSDIAVPEQPQREHLYTFYVATRSGGLFKTTNNGTTFEPLFDDQAVASIGAVEVAPSDPDVVWVGTGTADNARSAYYGDGVYRSTDGGASFRHMGLADSHHIARIIIHPDDPDTVWIAAMGHLFTPNDERGVFKTTDGGTTWRKVLYVSDTTGAIDVVINRDDTDTLYAAMYEKYRYPWHFEEGGAESGIYRSRDGGETWSRLEGGLPSGKIGRIGIDVYRGDPRIVYAVIENANPQPAGAGPAGRGGRGPQIIGGEVYRSADGGDTWTRMNGDTNVGGKAMYSFHQIMIDPNDDQRLFVNSDTVPNSRDGGRTWSDVSWPPSFFPSMFGDVRAMWIDPHNSDRIILGTDGGVHISYDGGATSDHHDNLPLGEFYAVDVDMEDPYNIYGGLQDHESWKGPVNSWSGDVSLEDWTTVGTGDGMYNRVDPADSRWVYNTSQHGGHMRVDQQLRTRTRIQPVRQDTRAWRGRATTASGSLIETRQDELPYRFTWNTPIALSPHNSQVLYTGGQALLRSFDRGDHWEEISPDLTTNDAEKVAGRGNIQYCTITTISEAAHTAGVIWVGTDDGRVWVTTDHGATWDERTAAVVAAGAPQDYWVSRVVASSHRPGTAYITKSGYRRDDFRPFVYRTTDYGESWVEIVDGLAESPVNVLYEDAANPHLLYLGNDRGVHVSLDGGDRWVAMRGDMPTVPVHDIVVQPREGDLVVATYGRGLFVTDVSWLRELTPEVLASALHLFSIEPKPIVPQRAWGNYKLYGDRHIATSNEPPGLVINYFLGAAGAEASIQIRDVEGEVVGSLSGSANAGMNRVRWSGRGGGGGGERGAGRAIEPGRYRIVIAVGEHRAERWAELR